MAELEIVDEEGIKKRRQEVARLLYEGEKRGAQILVHIEKKYKVKRDIVLEDLRIVREDIRLHRERNLIYVVHEHMERYEYLYNKFLKMDRTDLQNKALKQKEALSGCQRMLLESDSDPEKSELKSSFDWSKLTIPEKDDFAGLVVRIEKSKAKKEKEKNQ